MFGMVLSPNAYCCRILVQTLLGKLLALFDAGFDSSVGCSPFSISFSVGKDSFWSFIIVSIIVSAMDVKFRACVTKHKS